MKTNESTGAENTAPSMCAHAHTAQHPVEHVGCLAAVVAIARCTPKVLEPVEIRAAMGLREELGDVALDTTIAVAALEMTIGILRSDFEDPAGCAQSFGALRAVGLLGIDRPLARTLAAFAGETAALGGEESSDIHAAAAGKVSALLDDADARPLSDAAVALAAYVLHFIANSAPGYDHDLLVAWCRYFGWAADPIDEVYA